MSFWTGGVWKTTNNGTTFEPLFDQQSTLAMGDVTIAPSNPEVVWVGTGDAFTSRSWFAGDGVYKSTDGGATWTKEPASRRQAARPADVRLRRRDPAGRVGGRVPGSRRARDARQPRARAASGLTGPDGGPVTMMEAGSSDPAT